MTNSILCPKLDYYFTALAQGDKFYAVDLLHDYQQVLSDDESLCQHQHVPKSLPRVMTIIDDILITTANYVEHKSMLT